MFDSSFIPYKQTHKNSGGDEVDTSCWSKTERIKQWMKTKGMTENDAYLYFINKAQASARALGKYVVGWEEIWRYFGTQLDKNTIIHVWKGTSTVGINATANGYRILWNPSAWWYLDHLDIVWTTMYSQEPCNNIPDDRCKTLVLGGMNQHILN